MAMESNPLSSVGENLPTNHQPPKVEIVLDLIKEEKFTFMPSEGLPDLYIPVKNRSWKPHCLEDVDYIFIDPMIIYGFEVLPTGAQ